MDGLAFPAAGCDRACAEGGAMFGISLCAGAGGLDLGLHIAVPEYRTVAYVERESYAAATLVARMEDAALDRAPVWDDVATFDGRPWRGLVDIIHGGYPCQPFSVAGRQLGNKDPRHLWPHIARIVSEIQPPLCFFENVSGHLRLGFEQVHDDLRQMGYCVKAGLFTAEEIGAPHRRERLFILAYTESAGNQRKAGDFCPTQRRPDGSVLRLPDGADGVMADCDGHGRNQGRPQQPPRQRQPSPPGSGGAAAMVHAERAERRQEQSEGDVGNRRVAERQETSGRAGEPGRSNMADADGQSEFQSPNQANAFAVEGRTRPESGDGGGDAHMADTARLFGQTLQRGEPDGAGALVGNADDAGLEGWNGDGGCENELPAWPPSPAEHERWDGIPADLKPAIRRMVDGLAYRVDRLRLCGNGVVPLVAAYAFRTLAAAANLNR